MKWYRWVLIVFLLLLMSGGVLLGMLGGRNLLQAMWSVERLTGQERDTARAMLWGAGYSGILAHLDKNGNYVWVWTKNGLRRFELNESTAYSTWRVCESETLKLIEQGNNFRPTPYVTKDIEDWRELARVGDFVVVKPVINIDQGGLLGTAKELIDYEWWVFVPVNMGAQCSKR